MSRKGDEIPMQCSNSTTENCVACLLSNVIKQLKTNADVQSSLHSRELAMLAMIIDKLNRIEVTFCGKGDKLWTE